MYLVYVNIVFVEFLKRKRFLKYYLATIPSYIMQAGEPSFARCCPCKSRNTQFRVYKPSWDPWFYSVHQLKIEANRSRSLRILSGHTNKAFYFTYVEAGLYLFCILNNKRLQATLVCFPFSISLKTS